jgi:hypothetical protein
MKAKSEFLETQEPLTYSIPFAGSLVGIGKNASYAAARRGEIPTIRFGKKLRVPRAKFLRMLSGEEGVALPQTLNDADTPAAVNLRAQQRSRSEKP